MLFFKNRTKNPLDREQINIIRNATGCSKSEAIKRAANAVKQGMDVNEFMKQQFYMMSPSELSSFLKKSNAKRYVKALTDRYKGKGISAYEIYKRMKRARKDFGIPYPVFAKKDLINASDERLKKIQAKREEKKVKAVSRIADAMNISNEEAQKIVKKIQTKFGYDAPRIYQSKLYGLSDTEIAKYKLKQLQHRKDVLKKVAKETGWSDAEINTHITHCNLEYGIDPAMYYCCKCYEMDEEHLARLGNMGDSKKISRRCNKGNNRYLFDKALFNDTYKEYLGRKYWVNQNTSFEEFQEFIAGLDEVFCKPFDASTGLGTYKYDLRGKDPKKVYEYFMNEPKYLIEECVIQHPEMAKFHPKSLNTVRIVSILQDGEFDAFASFVRFGNGGVIDNFSGGGMSCSVDPKTGIIFTNASDKDGNVYETHPITGEKFKGFQIPHWDKVLERAEMALRSFEPINYVGWDIAIRDDDVVLIEGNSSPDFGVSQAPSIHEGIYNRPDYYKYLGTSVYDDMLEKVIANMTLTNRSQKYVTKRLMAAADHGFDYDFVEKNQLCKLSVPQIKHYAENEQVRNAVNKVAEDNNVPVANAYMRMRNVEKKCGISFEDFANDNLYNADEKTLSRLAAN